MCEYAGAETAASAAATEAVYSVKNATTEATQQPSMQDGHRSVYAKNIMAEHVAKQQADAVAARGEWKTIGRRSPTTKGVHHQGNIPSHRNTRTGGSRGAQGKTGELAAWAQLRVQAAVAVHSGT